MKKLLSKVFRELDKCIAEENRARKETGALAVAKCEVKILGQMSLLVNEKVSGVLNLAQTGDMDALLTQGTFSMTALKRILKDNGLVYDEDSEKVWIPAEAKFETIFSFSNVLVKIIDPKSALVSKAIKAPQKNKILIREAIASGKFDGLVESILKHGGKLDYFT